MAIYFAVFDQQSSGFTLPTEPKFAGGELLTPIEIGKICKLEATSVAVAKQGLEEIYGGEIAHKMTLVTEAEWVEGS